MINMSDGFLFSCNVFLLRITLHKVETAPNIFIINLSELYSEDYLKVHLFDISIY